MANIKSQKKRILTSRKEKQINTAKRSKVKTAIKKFEAAIMANDLQKAEELLPLTYKVIDEAKSDGIFHINNASRKKARLAKMLDNAQKTVKEA
ncbi:MAG: 30S ribosomal protein S20 [Christensenellales bacterium]|jgi:small subunit ribosomal protein S20|nr:30S ribosomal protein S20 [Clostridiales bacterium]